MQKVIDLPHVRVLFQKVPAGIYAWMHFIHFGKLYTNDQAPGDYMWKLPKGSWELLGVYPDIKEEHVKCLFGGESLRSLLISNGLPVEGVRYAVLVEYK